MRGSDLLEQYSTLLKIGPATRTATGWKGSSTLLNNGHDIYLLPFLAYWSTSATGEFSARQRDRCTE
jgi:hypothetical protein